MPSKAALTKASEMGGNYPQATHTQKRDDIVHKGYHYYVGKYI